jgi:hypothetical protein
VTAGLVAVVALQADPQDANPKEILALIFGIIGTFVVLMFLLQSLDLRRAEATDARTPAVEPGDIDNPATMEERDLFAAMAVHPIDADAVRARREIWGTVRTSMRTGMLVTGLIFLSVPPVYLLDTFIPLIVGGSLIAAIALFKSASLMSSGGDLDKAYDLASRAMAPLGLKVMERPTIVIEPKSVAPFRMGPTLRGALVLEGARHGRDITIRMPSGGVRTASEVAIAGAAPEFEFKARDGRLKAGEGAPDTVAAALKSVPNSTRWNGVRGGGDAGALVVGRKGAASGDMLLDLWLGERLAEALKP